MHPSKKPLAKITDFVEAMELVKKEKIAHSKGQQHAIQLTRIELLSLLSNSKGDEAERICKLLLRIETIDNHDSCLIR